MLRILENRNDVCKNQIINIGNPENECSVRELADPPEDGSSWTIRIISGTASYSEIIEVPAQTYYGKGYQDIYTRKPSIEKAEASSGGRRRSGWRIPCG